MKSEIKHNISVLEAESVFDDPNKIIFFDPKHSNEEYRYICIGKSHLNQILFAAFTFRDEDLIRVISKEKRIKKREAFMKNIDKKKATVKQMPNEDTTKYIDYSQSLNFRQLIKNSNASFKKKPRKKAASGASDQKTFAYCQQEISL